MLIADIRTLLIATVAVNFLMALALGFVSRSNGMSPLRWWSLGLLLHAVSYWLLWLRGTIPDAFSIVVANTVESVFAALWALVIAQLQQRPLHRAWLLIPPLLTALVCIVFIDEIAPRSLFYNIILMVQTGLAAYLLYERRTEDHGQGRLILLLALNATILILLVRIIAMASGIEEVQTLTTRGTLQTLIFLTAMAIPAVASLGFLFMMKEHLDRQIEENHHVQDDQRQAMERTLAETAERFRTIYDTIYNAIFVHDATTGRILDINASACSMYGYTREQMLELDVAAISSGTPPHTLDAARAYISECEKVGWCAFEWLARDSTGRLFWVAVNLKRLMLGDTQRILAVVRDIDSRKRTEETLQRTLAETKALNAKLAEAQNQLLQSEKMASIGQLAAGVAHELNNPIGFVHSNLGTLRHYLDDIFRVAAVCETAAGSAANPEDFKRINTLKSEIDFDFLKSDVYQLMGESAEGLLRVKKIVQDLKDFSRPGEAVWQLADLHQGLDSTLNIVWNELKYKCTVTKQYGDLPRVWCVPSQLNQVFMNLLVNAAHAIPDKGEITITTQRSGDHVQVMIEDTGNGIAPEHLTHIFEPFFTTKPVGKGTGLGLSIVWGIIQKHHGNIEVNSEPGKGTRFIMTLPIEPPPELAEPTQDGNAVPPAPTLEKQ